MNQQQPEEQLLYAAWLDWGTRIGLVTLVAVFVAYGSGLLAPHIPLSELPKVWSLPVGQFLAATGLPAGWGWVRYVYQGDIANLVGISIMAGTSMLCLLVLVRLYLKKGDRMFAAICLAEIAVLLLAASGVLTAGH